MNQNELYHYGVLGMHWGQRRASRKGVPYQYKSMGQKEYEKKFNKSKAKAERKTTVGRQKNLAINKTKYETFKTRDLNREAYAKTASAGKSLVKTILFGPLGNGNYSRMRSGGAGRVGSALVSNWLAGTIGYPLTLAVSKSYENSAARRENHAVERFKNSVKED